MSVSVSPSLQYVLVGLRSDRMFGYFLRIGDGKEIVVTDSSDSGSNNSSLTHFVLFDKHSEDSISCLKWMARPGDGAIIGYRSFHLRCIQYK